ncbi:hypothetical protein TNCV_1427731 [Trichonephila clavipes]|nr:hypothetical protein TNCV_1427731 [Trichonephila clavipes]
MDNVILNGQGIKESKGEVVLTCEFKKESCIVLGVVAPHRPGMTDELLRGRCREWGGPLTPAKGMGSFPPLGMWNGKWQGFGLWVRRSEVMSECC